MQEAHNPIFVSYHLMRKRLTNVNVTKPKPTNSSPILMIGYELKNARWRQGVLHFQTGEHVCTKFNDAIS